MLLLLVERMAQRGGLCGTLFRFLSIFGGDWGVMRRVADRDDRSAIASQG